MIDVQNLRAGYREFTLQDISLRLPEGRFSALIGPNGCGKSTLFAAIAGLLPVRAGGVRIGGMDVAQTRPRALARQVALLPQSPVVPPAIRVAQLVGYGRAPYQNMLGLKRPGDEAAIAAAMDRAGVADLANRRLSDLSGGQRQRVFIAMTLAQDAPVMLFDEPTSFLDIRYQVEVLELLADLARAGRTIVAVLHDIGQAARYAEHLVVMKDGALRYQGPPETVVTRAMLSAVYEVGAAVYRDPIAGSIQISPDRQSGTGYSPSTLAE